MNIQCEIKVLNFCLIMCLSRLLVSISSEGERMSGPKRYQGVFRKQSTNKTIPYCERPGKELIIIDIDGTIWPYNIDKDPRFHDPFRIESGDGKNVTVNGHQIQLYPEVEETLLELREKGYVLAALSLTNSSVKTMALLNAFDLTKHFKYMELANGPDKLGLITEIEEKSGIKVKDLMLLMCQYDRIDIHSMLDIGVYTLPIGISGINFKLMTEALYMFNTRKISAEISDDELPSTTESRAERKKRLKLEKWERRMFKKNKTLNKNQ